MAKDPASSAESIERLLGEREKVEQWMHRLAVAADKTPGHVRDRVEADYKRRLDDVVTELQSYREELQSKLAHHKSKHNELTSEENEASERLAEAELRHAVGEFDDGRWSEIKADILSTLSKVRDNLKEVDAEIGGLEEVMALIERGPTHGPVGRAGAADEDLDAVLDAAIQESQSEPKQTVKSGSRPESRARDELEFLRSVTEDENQGPAAARASGSIRIPEEVVAERQVSEVEDTAQDDLIIEEIPANEPKKAAAKTLKCDECGTMNLPTEWYCERCGAELAAL